MPEPSAAPSAAPSTGSSVSFDRAADYYDRTRALPAARAAAQTELLAGQLTQAVGPCLEIGVGTGRVALPLAAAGHRVIGLDLSAPMLERLRAKDPAATVPVVRADALALPFARGAFGAALACHVLHLVADWVRAVQELVRVVVPGGVLLVTRGVARDGMLAQLSARIRVEADLPRDPTRLDDLDKLDAYLYGRGATLTQLPAIDVGPDEPVGSVEDFLALTADGVSSWTWGADPDRLRAAVASVRSWVSRELGDPSVLPAPPPPIRWHRYRLPG